MLTISGSARKLPDKSWHITEIQRSRGQRVEQISVLKELIILSALWQNILILILIELYIKTFFFTLWNHDCAKIVADTLIILFNDVNIPDKLVIDVSADLSNLCFLFVHCISVCLSVCFVDAGITFCKHSLDHKQNACVCRCVCVCVCVCIQRVPHSEAFTVADFFHQNFNYSQTSLVRSPSTTLLNIATSA